MCVYCHGVRSMCALVRTHVYVCVREKERELDYKEVRPAMLQITVYKFVSVVTSLRVGSFLSTRCCCCFNILGTVANAFLP